MESPKLIFLFSGKRKCGKDYIAEKLLEKLSTKHCTIVRISEPIKSYYAKTFNLDLTQLLSDGVYKEKYRKDMIDWSEKIRADDYGYFCRAACKNANVTNIWITSDVRRKSDLKWFRENYPNIIKTVRIKANVDVRKERGWNFTEGVDDVPSECDLDDVEEWDFEFTNDSTNANDIVQTLFECIDNVYLHDFLHSNILQCFERKS